MRDEIIYSTCNIDTISHDLLTQRLTFKLVRVILIFGLTICSKVSIDKTWIINIQQLTVNKNKHP